MASPLGKWLAHVKRVRLAAVFTRPQRPFTLVTGNESCGTLPECPHKATNLPSNPLSHVPPLRFRASTRGNLVLLGA
jgi:hypothetical protein